MTSQRDSSDPAYYDALGRAIQVLRVERGLSRKDLSEASGLSYPYLSEIENGKKRPSSESLLAIANAFGMRPSELMERAEVYRGTAPAEPHNPRFEGMAPTHEWTSDEGGVPDSVMSAAMMMPSTDAPVPDAPQTWVRAGSRKSTSKGAPQRSASRETNTPAPSDVEDLMTLARRLGPEDVRRLIDLARRLSG